MRMKSILLASTALVWGAVAQGQTANFDAEDAIALFRDEMGFERVEVKQGLTQLKVEAIKGSIKLEVIYDRETGAIIKQEQETVEAGDDTAPGVETRVVDKDFIDDASAASAGSGSVGSGSSDSSVFSAEDAIALFRDEMGFERVEVKQGLTQLKVEAIKGNIKLEVIYDRETGAIIKQEQETVEAGDDTAPGVEIRVVDKDFMDDDDDDRDDDNSGPGNSDDDDDDRDDDNSGPGNSDDDDDDRDDDNSGSGNSDDDDDEGDDDNSGSGNSDDDDDDRDDDNSGPGNSDDD